MAHPDKTLSRWCAERGISYRTGYGYVNKGWVPVYTVTLKSGRKAACVNSAEANAALAARKGKARPDYGKFGPDAVVRDLTKVVLDFEVAE